MARGERGRTEAPLHPELRANAASTPATVLDRRPGVAPVVVAVLLPEAGFVVVEEAQSGDPFGAFTKVQVGNEEAGGAAVLAGRASPLTSQATQALPPVTSATGRLVV